MVVSLLVTFSTLLFIVGPAGAQVSAPNCSEPINGWDWSLNSLRQDPCLVAAYLGSVCNSGSFTISPLLPGYSYTGPSGLDNGNLCKCNTVIYNLLSACDECQGGSPIPYSEWTANCTAVAAAGTFPESVPVGTRVPKWAYLDPTSGGTWNLTAARLAGNSPEVTGSVTIAPTSTRNSKSTLTPSPSSSSVSPSKDSSNGGDIAKGVVGGIIGVALVAVAIALWFIIRRWRARSAPYAGSIDSQSDMGKPVIPHPQTFETQRIYDPSNPSTYPSWTPSTMTPMSNYSGQFSGSRSGLRYSGLPEV